ncbi:MAG TPA: Minf_1886 family protein [Pirellulales bacterium]
MVPPSHPFAPILTEDPRYSLPAYFFVFDALRYAHQHLSLGASSASDEPGEEERHVTGQEFCEAIRQYALEQFGYMTKVVLNSWGVYSTGDFGEIVYNLIRHGRMKKTDEDRREHFDDVFDFQKEFVDRFRFPPPDA